MKYRHLGKSGLLVSRVCLGTMTFGNRDWGCDKKISLGMVDRFLEAGGNFIDTADIYNDGLTEEIIGEGIGSKDRTSIVLATKCFFRMGKDPNAAGLSRKHVVEACDASLKRLRTDYIDLFQIHGPDPHTPFEETMRALDDLVRRGKVRYTGCSNLYAWQVLKANSAAERLNLAKFASGQYLYNLIVRDVEREILPACADQGMGFICWSPLGGGMLTGKYERAERPDAGTRMSLAARHEMPRYWHERGFGIAGAVAAAAEKLGKTPSLTALSWLLHDRRVASVIVGSTSLEQLAGNLSAGEWDLPEDVWARLDALSSLDHGYPKQWIDIAIPETFTANET
jgi:1-deoxyxylulose-5-phosphate synthase